MQPEYTARSSTGSRRSRGHLDGVVRMVEEDVHCIDVMKQISALQASLERANRLVLLNHLETCFSGAVEEGRGVEVVAELVDALKFHDGLTGPGIAVALGADGELAHTAPA